jgi:hypothetical protein
MRMCSTLLAPALALALAACGRSSPVAPAAEIELLRVLASGVAADTEAYGVRATSMADRAACRAARGDYEEQVRPRIERMVAIAPRVDRWLQARGPSEHVDAECTTSTMRDELERHLAIACSSPDVVANRAEAERHLDAMGRWADLAIARAEEAGGALAPGSAVRVEGGPRCVRFSDGNEMYLP